MSDHSGKSTAVTTLTFRAMPLGRAAKMLADDVLSTKQPIQAGLLLVQICIWTREQDDTPCTD